MYSENLRVYTLRQHSIFKCVDPTPDSDKLSVPTRLQYYVSLKGMEMLAFIYVLDGTSSRKMHRIVSHPFNVPDITFSPKGAKRHVFTSSN
ncbi:hypothetical protein V6N11_006897 [Hibiscus sabdariffa]|uniref:Uncharacterized protein n=1 Tax=Hibiscus sabdariffa TaxID=183260 RepID=A0ABR2RSL6_9ROSI